MTRDDIIRIYSQVSDELCGGTEWCWHGVGEPLQRFAELVVAAEREACAKMIEDEPPLVDFAKNIYGACVVCGLTPKLIAAFIRARGQE